MGKLAYFVFGVIVGGIVVPFLLGLQDGYNEAMEAEDNPFHLRGLRMVTGECITEKNLEVFQVIGDGIALAYPINMYDPVVLLIGNRDKLFYDNEIVKNPAKHCAKQIGVYTYQAKDETIKTVPAVSIEEK